MSYGLLCLAMAYLAHLMGDSVLQVSLQLLASTKEYFLLSFFFWFNVFSA